MHRIKGLLQGVIIERNITFRSWDEWFTASPPEQVCDSHHCTGLRTEGDPRLAGDPKTHSITVLLHCTTLKSHQGLDSRCEEAKKAQGADYTRCALWKPKGIWISSGLRKPGTQTSHPGWKIVCATSCHLSSLAKFIPISYFAALGSCCVWSLRSSSRGSAGERGLSCASDTLNRAAWGGQHSECFLHSLLFRLRALFPTPQLPTSVPLKPFPAPYWCAPSGAGGREEGSAAPPPGGSTTEALPLGAHWSREGVRAAVRRCGPFPAASAAG